MEVCMFYKVWHFYGSVCCSIGKQVEQENVLVSSESERDNSRSFSRENTPLASRILREHQGCLESTTIQIPFKMYDNGDALAYVFMVAEKLDSNVSYVVGAESIQ
ncbi:hypothetical protein LIER_43952 [Lithospermum erythrorhizon]|uniref:Uncharacterized protein n=1 Tax=Lithospermum erythrorhizon TaxID=34254 RepID=A0AAV3REG8_LITER